MEAQAALRELSGPWGMGDKIKRAIDRAAKRAGLPYWRAFDLWYGKARKADDVELQKIRDALTKKRKEEARNELHELRTRIAQMEARLVRVDADFFGEEITYARNQLRQLGGSGGADDSAVD